MAPAAVEPNIDNGLNMPAFEDEANDAVGLTAAEIKMLLEPGNHGEEDDPLLEAVAESEGPQASPSHDNSSPRQESVARKASGKAGGRGAGKESPHRSPLKKFLFDTSFDVSAEPATPVPAAAGEEGEVSAIHVEPLPPLPPPSYSEAQLQSACEAARAEAQETSRAELMAGQAAQQLQLLDAVAHRIPAACAELQADFDRLSAEVARIAVALVAKILPTYSREQGAAEVTEFVRQTIDYALGRPRLRIKLHPQNVEDLQPVLQGLAERHGFVGKVELVADSQLLLADVVMDWGDGSSEKLEKRIWEAIGQMMPTAREKLENKSDGAQ
ncbi:MAG: FliH/SctL family protein [Alphaproteobacteria bacterium]|nr:FliH/SctL family protein [Alphaproteobacteria bacterium]